ncbi:hypothetical protein [Allokutzneria oryzae]|uniref:Uncharacterized protein n=1 Tax=Allokutzneria oryzae TaxID=1378989 RepID=A0ABV6A5I2_9PSEU
MGEGASAFATGPLLGDAVISGGLGLDLVPTGPLLGGAMISGGLGLDLVPTGPLLGGAMISGGLGLDLMPTGPLLGGAMINGGLGLDLMPTVAAAPAFAGAAVALVIGSLVSSRARRSRQPRHRAPAAIGSPRSLSGTPGRD